MMLVFMLSGFFTALSAQTLTLEQCIDTALLYNRNIRLSEQDINMAAVKNREAWSSLLPKLNAMADYRYYTDLPYQLMPASAFGGPAGTYKEVQFGVPQNLNANLQFAVPLFNAAALSAIKNTKTAAELAEIQKIKTDEEVVIEVTNVYYNAQILLNQLIFLDSNIINTSKLVQTVTLLYQQQVAKSTDVDRLKLQLEQVTTQRITVFSQHQQVLNTLKFLIGKSISDSISVSPGENSLVGEIFQPRVTTEMQLIDKKLELDYAALRGIKNSRLPTLSAYGVYGTTGFGTTGSNSFFNLHPIGYVGAQLSVPIFNGWSTKQKIAGKKIEIEKTAIQRELITEKASLELINAEKQYTLASSNIEVAQSQIELAKKIYSNTLLQNRQGIATITDVLLADNALREAQQGYIVAMVNLRRAELEYKRVTGNLLSTNINKR
ncbi:MAG: TolC family protein [Bacteroidales bacterium]|nr:TolC family protein [Bacteroidales bacterium]